MRLPLSAVNVYQLLHMQRLLCFIFQTKNSEFYSQFITEDIHGYLNRKRMEHCHGNHVEIQAMCEIYNRSIEVYQYSIGLSQLI